MFRSSTLAGLLAGALFCAPASADVSVQVFYPASAQGDATAATIALAGQPRLADLLDKLTLTSPPDWRASRISTPAADAKMQQLQQQVLAALNDVMLSAERAHTPEQAYNARLLLQLIARLPVAGRVATELDPDWVRIRRELNPRLEGRYTLWLQPRQPVLQIIGLINGAETVALEPGRGVADYLAERDWFMGAEERAVYLCQPDGQISRLPVESWSTLHREPMPGATLLIGLDERQLPAAYHALNHQIATLLAARIAS